MKINRHNYEAFFIDFFDGNLSETDASLLFSFLDENPDLKAEFNSFEMHTLEPEAGLTYNDKADLKRPSISFENYQTFLIADIENDLDSHGKQQLNAFIEKNPHVHFEAALFEKTKLTSTAEPYEEKESLKRPLVIPIYANQKFQLAVAAAVALLLLFTQVFLNDDSNQSFVADSTEIISNDNSIENNNTIATVDVEKSESIIDGNENYLVDGIQSGETSIQLASLNRVDVSKARVIKTNANEDVYSEANAIPVDLTAYQYRSSDELELAERSNTSFVSQEAVYKDTEGEFTRMAGNTISGLTNNKVDVESKKTKSGLLRSWKLQAGNFSITHTKN
ncbi:MAG: hypothetical protein HKN75_07660 [Bacteroidia bacterium]|nr:hypothetical protein [Bacteroidia bacterium]